MLAKPSPQPDLGSVAPFTLKEKQACKVECDARKRKNPVFDMQSYNRSCLVKKRTGAQG